MSGKIKALVASAVRFARTAVGAVVRTVLDKLLDIVSAKDFGAVGDNVADDTAAIQAALDYAAQKGKGVYVPAGIYKVTKLRIKNGCKAFWTDCATLIGSTNVHEGVIEMEGLFFSTPAVEGCEVYGFLIDGGGVARRGIFAATAYGCVIFNNHIRNLSPDAPEGGMTLHFSSSQNRIYANRIELPVGPDCVGIYAISTTVDQYSGWMNGAIVDPTNVASHNTISGNFVDGGSHGIALFGARYNNVTGNILRGQRDRSIILSPASCYNTITGNTCLDFGSTGVHMAYGSNGNLVSANTVMSLNSTGEAGIQAYVACSGNKVQGNWIACASKYGIYFAVDATYNEAIDNRITGNIVKAGIAIDSDWSGALPANALYSRPNFGPPAAPRVNWPNGETYGNTIKGNTLIDLPPGAAAIALAQIGANATNQDNTVLENVVNGAAPRHYLHIFEATNAKAFGHVVERNKFQQFDVSRIYMTRGRAHLKSCSGNAILNETGTFYDFPMAATLDVSGVDTVSTALFTAATAVTNFTGGMFGQFLIVRMSVFTTIQNNANIKLKGGVNASGANANDYLTFRNLNGVWVEMSRTF